jgi:CRP-like cAMP-binding protein
VPQSISYKGNSVIFFRGDASKKIYILQSGRVILKREDIETGQEVQEAIQQGEFFGVKSALGKYDRDEDAIVISDSVVVMFTVEEFEQLVASNTRIGIKMLKVFSNQLRRVHSKVQSLLAVEERNPEDGLFSNAEFYLKKKRYVEAIHILRRYLKLFSQGRYIVQAQKYLNLSEEYLSKYGANNGPAIIGENSKSGLSVDKSRSKAEATADEKDFYDALSDSGQGNYQQAIEKFQQLLSTSSNGAIKAQCAMEIGRCYFGRKEYDQCVRYYGGMIKSNPDHSDLGEAMFLVGQCYEQLGDKAKAANVYERLMQMSGLHSDLQKKVKHAHNGLGGS